MATPDWGAIESAYRAGVMSLRDIGAQHGITEGAIRKRAIKLEWVRNKKNSTQSGTQESKVRKESTHVKYAKKKTRTSKPRDTHVDADKSPSSNSVENPSDTKRIRGSRHAPPTSPFLPNNQAALKHGGYARRMLLGDEVIEDARELTLDDELFRLRASSLVAAANIGRWTTKLEDANDDEKKALVANIEAAEKAMMRNTVRIESLEYTKATIRKTLYDTDYREAATEKVELEIENLKNGDNGNSQIIIHSSLHIPGSK